MMAENKVFALSLKLLIFFLMLEKSHSEVFKVSQSFQIKWNISENEFFIKRPCSSANNDCIKKTLYRFVDIGNLTFHLCLQQDCSYSHCPYKVIILPESLEHDISHGMYLDYAFTATPDEIFNLGGSNDFQFRSNFLESRYFDYSPYKNLFFPNGTMTIYCKITIQNDVIENVYNRNSYEYKLFVPLRKVNLQDEKITNYRIKKQSDLDEYRGSGKIPTFTVLAAKNILSGYKYMYSDITEFRALAIEYLMQHLTSENVLDILKISVKEGISNLRDKCLEFLSSNCKISMK